LLHAGHGDHALAGAHRRPEVDYHAAQALASDADVTAMIDVSDGLLSDLGHIAEQSGVSIELDSNRLVIDPLVSAAAAELGLDPLLWVATGGDDHAFAATIRGDAPNGVTIVGKAVAVGPGESPTVTFTDRETPQNGGHEHFAVS
jgi:thiamine-monophosphate kinase